MVGRLESWKVGLLVISGVCLSNIPTVQLSAQVGHDPGSSPYRDIPVHPGPMLFVGHLSGDRGKAESGMSNARTFGLRYELPAGRALIFQFSGVYFKGDRFVINPYVNATAPQRKTGPFETDLGMGEIGMQLRLTGGKTWRGFAPYAGMALGLMFDVKEPRDTSGYRFGTKLTPAVAAGARWYPARHTCGYRSTRRKHCARLTVNRNRNRAGGV
jgi:hypothetical protein